MGRCAWFVGQSARRLDLGRRFPFWLGVKLRLGLRLWRRLRLCLGSRLLRVPRPSRGPHRAASARWGGSSAWAGFFGRPCPRRWLSFWLAFDLLLNHLRRWRCFHFARWLLGKIFKILRLQRFRRRCLFLGGPTCTLLAPLQALTHPFPHTALVAHWPVRGQSQPDGAQDTGPGVPIYNGALSSEL